MRISNRPGYPHPVSSELEIRVAVGDCSVTERRRWRPPYQTGKTVHVHAKHYKHNEDGGMARGVCGNGSVPLSHSGNVVMRIGIHTHIHRSIIVNFHQKLVVYYILDYFGILFILEINSVLIEFILWDQRLLKGFIFREIF